MKPTSIITLRHVSKKFIKKGRKDHTVLSLMTGKYSSTTRQLWAVQDVSLKIEEGQVVGIIGDNASGKSTLLRLIAGILEPDCGSVLVEKPLISIMQFTIGIRPHLTVRENIFLISALYGMPRAYVRDVFTDIVAFGELEEYIDMYVYQLSSGYRQRLGFSIAIHCKPQILLLDEVFSAGDMAFKAKAQQRMEELVCSNVTVVMATHNLLLLQNIADRVLWLEDGRIKQDGEPSSVLADYRAQQAARVL